MGKTLLLLSVLATVSPSFGGHEELKTQLHSYPVTCPANILEKVRQLSEKTLQEKGLDDTEKKALREALSSVPNGCFGEELEKKALTACRWLGVLPCTTASLKKPISVVFSSEFHGEKESLHQFRTQYWDPRDTAGTRRAFVIERNTGGLPFGIETMTKGRVLEGDGPHATALVKFYHYVDVSTKQKDFHSLALAKYLEMPELAAAWKQVSRPFANAEVEKIACVLDASIVAQRGVADADVEQARRSVKGHGSISKEQFLPLAEAIFAQAARGARPATRASEFTGRKPIPALAAMTADKQLEAQFLSDVAMGARDLNLAHRTAEQICRWGTQENSEIVVHAGGAHSAEIFLELQNILKRSAAEDVVQLTVDGSLLDKTFATYFRLVEPKAFQVMRDGFKKIPEKFFVRKGTYSIALAEPTASSLPQAKEEVAKFSELLKTHVEKNSLIQNRDALAKEVNHLFPFKPGSEVVIHGYDPDFIHNQENLLREFPQGSRKGLASPLLQIRLEAPDPKNAKGGVIPVGYILFRTPAAEKETKVISALPEVQFFFDPKFLADAVRKK